jgi:integrase
MHVIPKAGIVRILEAAHNSSTQDWLMILVGFTHALRVSEIVALTPDNVSGEYLIVQRLKGSKKTTQPILGNENALLSEHDALIDLARKTPRKQRLFPISRATFWRRMQTYCEEAGIPKHMRHPHVLKHACLSQIAKGKDIKVTQEWAGHTSMNSTAAYLHPTDQEIAEEVKRALEI